MGTLRFTTEELEMFRSHPLPWFDQAARWLLGTVAPGVPTPEVDENEAPTGWLIMSHPGIAYREQHSLTVLRAWWAYADAQANPVAAHNKRSADDWKVWGKLKASVANGTLSVEDARDQVWDYIVALGTELGVPSPQE